MNGAITGNSNKAAVSEIGRKFFFIRGKFRQVFPIIFCGKTNVMKKIFSISNCLFVFFLLSLSRQTFSQRVGIGTNTPTEKLHVAGNIKADTVKPNALKLTTNAGEGKVLMSDATGNASWQTIPAGSVGGNVGFGVWGNCDGNGNISEYLPVVDPAAAIGDAFGSSIAISGDYSIIGAPTDDVGANNNQGSASIFQFNGTGWVFIQKLTDATGSANDQFGISVSISGNYAIVGAWQDAIGANAGQGSASIYRFNGTSWVLMQKITDATGTADDSFGCSVTISGNRAIVGAFFEQVGANTVQGSASIYQFNGTTWVLMQKITDAAGVAGDRFGYSVSLSGNYAIIGAPGYDLDPAFGYVDFGAAHIYQYNGTNWVSMQKIQGTGSTGDWFGVSVSIDGSYAIVGAYQSDLSQNKPDQGAAVIFRYDGNSWVMTQTMYNMDGKPYDKFGNSVAISGDYAVVGIYNHDSGSNAVQADVGAAIIYRRMGAAWQRIQYLTDPGANTEDWFGFSVALDGISKRFASGAIRHGNSSGKVVFGKIN